MLGGLLALLSAAGFAFETATARRGVVSASVVQAMAITVPIGVPIFFLIVWASGNLGAIGRLPLTAVALLAAAGILHFVWGRYCNYRATKAMGSNLVAPVQQFNLLLTLVLAIWLLGEQLTVLRLFGIGLVVLGPMLAYERVRKPATADVSAAPIEKPVFHPRYAEGYTFALLSSAGYGVSPVLVRMALEDRGLEFSLAGGLVSYLAATVVFALVLLLPGQLRHAVSTNRDSARWFVVSGVCVCLSQMLRYMALAIAPVSVVTPIQRLSMIFRLYFSRLLNPDHEIFGRRVIAATFVSLAGALALTLSVEMIQAVLPLPASAVEALNWRWP